MEEWGFSKSADVRGWNTGKEHECSTACSWSDKNKKEFNVIISREVFSVIRKLCKDVKVEWQILLCGTEAGDGLIVDNYYIPKQEVTGGSVKNLDCIDAEFIRLHNVVATMHSHSNMGVFFSTVDMQFTNNSLIKTHLVVNNKLEYIAATRVELPCGMVKFIDAGVLFEDTQVGEVRGFDNIIMDKTPYGFNVSEFHTSSEYENKGWHGNEAGEDMYGHPLHNSSNDELHFGTDREERAGYKQTIKKQRKNKSKLGLVFGKGE